MAENNSEGHGEKTNEKMGQRRAKVVYLKCQCCGCRKKQADMSTPDLCKDCFRKHEKEYFKNPYTFGGMGKRADGDKRKKGKEFEKAKNFFEANNPEWYEK